MISFVENTLNSLLGGIQTMGNAAVHAMAPDNFEYYLCSLELLNSVGETKGFLSFVVMPNNITESRSNIATITKTNRGVATLFSSTFVPRDISINGTFGRKLRLLLGMKETENVSAIPFFGGNLGFDMLGGDVLVKTGYGLTRMLQKMVAASNELDDKGNPCVLLFNNYALNTHYVVEVMQDNYTQSTENAMIWFYSLEMKAVAPGEAVRSNSLQTGKFLASVGSQAIANSIQDILTSATSSITNLILQSPS